jgi:hypothetical protein
LGPLTYRQLWEGDPVARYYYTVEYEDGTMAEILIDGLSLRGGDETAVIIAGNRIRDGEISNKPFRRVFKSEKSPER